jgi:hypothetical protein
MGEESTAKIGQRRPEFHLGILQSCTQLWLATFLSFELTVTHWGWGGFNVQNMETIY